MKFQRYKSLLAQLTARTRLLGSIAVLLTLANILLAVKVFSMEDSQRTLFLPPTVTKEFWVQGDEVSPEYLEDLAMSLSSLALTYNPSNFRARSKRLLRYAAPFAHPELETRFEDEADNVERYRISSVFHVQHATTRGLRVALLGRLDRNTGTKSMESRRAAFLVEFANIDGTLFLTKLKEVDHADPFMDRGQPATAGG